MIVRFLYEQVTNVCPGTKQLLCDHPGSKSSIHQPHFEVTSKATHLQETQKDNIKKSQDKIFVLRNFWEKWKKCIITK